jgi:hypothetical protein
MQKLGKRCPVSKILKSVIFIVFIDNCLFTKVDPQTVNYFSESYVPGSWILMFSNSSIALCSGLFHPELQIPELILADHPANVDDQVRHKLVFLKAPVPPKYKLQSTSRC